MSGECSGAVVERGAAVALAGELPVGIAANVAACIAAGLGAAVPGWAGRPLVDAENLTSASSAHLPIPVLRCTAAGFAALLERSRVRPEGAALVVFPRYAQRMHTAEEYWREHARRALVTEELLGVGFAGPRAWVRSLTGSMPLLR